jgi:ABC-type cobalamin/Fe3+-siderophores transport system ATPase subunit
MVDELVAEFELEKTLDRRTQEISKGELQRTILAFCLLYGSPILLMDEPIFAMEPYQKTKSMAFLTDYAQRNDVNIAYSAHELDITRTYSDHMLVLYPDGRKPLIGPTADVFSRQIIEEAYDFPLAMLKQKESLYRDALKRSDPY